MKKFYLIAAAAAAVLAAGCAKNEVIQTQQEMTPVTFGVYNGRMATKAVSSTTYGQINTTALLQASDGFGVFAYYSDGAENEYDDDYTPAAPPEPAKSNFIPNFMYNQLVEYDTDHWTYTPIKYWPNEYNTTNAIGASIDKLTFFAYAPHVANFNIAADKGVSISDGAVGTPAAADEGITAMTANDATGDPTLTFKVPAAANNHIDLLWSDAATTNMTKQAIGTPVIFTFKHALSNLTILPIAVVDGNTIKQSGGAAVDAATDVKVNSITVTGQFDQEGTLNLATGVWSSTPAATDQTATFTLATPLSVKTIVDKDGADAAYADNPSNFPEFMFIPSSAGAKTYTITINYDFITNDSAVSGGKVTVHNVIHKDLTDITFTKGTKIKLYVGLGMTSVVLAATASDWDGTSKEIWLPVNL